MFTANPLLFVLAIHVACGALASAASVLDAGTVGPILGPSGKPMNVLYIICDDLRPQLEPYNISDPAHVKTPNLAKFAKSATIFKRAYVQQAVCSPSRNSFLSGRLPQNTKIWNFKGSFRTTNASWVTMPQYFKDKLGYLTNEQGKVFHPGHPANEDEPYSWTQPKDGGFPAFDPNHQITICDNQPGDPLQHPLSCVLPENKTVDHVLAQSTISRLQILAERQRSGKDSRPWATFHGALKPHPFWALPQWAFDEYPREQVPLPKHTEWIDNEPDLPYPEYYSCDSIDARSEVANNNLTILPYKPLPDDILRKVRQGYFAGVTHLDRMLGSVLDELERLGLENETIVSLHGDHGWSLGENAMFCKQSTTELQTRIPWMIRVPGHTNGGVVEDPVEIVDAYATLADLAAGADAHQDEGIDSKSLARVVLDPTLPVPGPIPGKEAVAFSVYPRCENASLDELTADVPGEPSMASLRAILPPGTPVGYNNPCIEVPREQFTHMGLTVRSKDWRYTEYRHWDGGKLAPKFRVEPASVQLYDHREDDCTSFDENGEQSNVVKDPRYESVVNELKDLLRIRFDKGA